MRATTYETKEPETLDWIDRNVRSGDTLLDVGANIGIYSLYAAKRAPGATLYSIEPESQNFARLCRNIVANRIRNIVPCNFPLADCEMLDFLYVHELTAGGSLHSFSVTSDSCKDTGAVLQQAAISTTVDRLVQHHHIPWPALMKLDVDGIEGRILDGAMDTLANAVFRSLIVEWNYRDESEITELKERLAQCGLMLHRKSEWVADLNGMLSRNLIFSK